MSLRNLARIYACILLLVAGICIGRSVCAHEGDDIELGRSIYLSGRLANGMAVRASRMGIMQTGEAVACVNCHRGSGLGQVEGDRFIPPITGRALFGGEVNRVVTVMDPSRGKAMNQFHQPYSPQQVSDAIRRGIHPSGRAMNELMPRYELDDKAASGLITYLQTLSTKSDPGVDDHVIKFATVITPNVGVFRRAAFLETLRAAVNQKNGSTMPGRRSMVPAAEFSMKTGRTWDLQVWELKGPPEQWLDQLLGLYAENPVFALISGMGDGEWTPVQEFCELSRVPCWFPSVKWTPAAPALYSLYFHRGVTLEAEAIADYFGNIYGSVTKILQIHGDNDAARAGAKALVTQLEMQEEIRMITRSISDSRDLRAAISDAGQYDAIVLWLNREEILALNGEPAFGKLTVFSGILGGAENLPVSSAWRAQARMVFPYELPSRRGANLAYFRSWLNSRGIELIDESMQSEVYFAASYLRDTLGEMLNNFHRDYLLERADSQLSLWQSRKAIDESLQRQNLRQRFVHYIESTSSPASSNDDAVNNPTTASSAARQARVTAADNLAARTGSTVYPSLSLGPGQRFASKGAYIVRFVGESDATIHLEADGPWRIP